jgi:hypothetical protein
MKKVLTVKEFASLGGKARWKGKTPKEISAAMSAIRRGKVDKQAQTTPSKKSV